MPAEEFAYDFGAPFLADTPDTRLTAELLVFAWSAELTSDSDKQAVAPAMALLNSKPVRDTRDGAVTTLFNTVVFSPDPLDTSSEVELIVRGVEEGLGDDAMAARDRTRGNYTADNL